MNEVCRTGERTTVKLQPGDTNNGKDLIVWLLFGFFLKACCLPFVPISNEISLVGDIS